MPPVRTELLLLSSTRVPGGAQLAYARDAIIEFLGNCRRIHFVPFAVADHDGYTAQIAAVLAEFGVDVVGVHVGDPRAAIDAAEVLYVGGGNSFRLLHWLRRLGLVDRIRARVRAGALRYMGASAGSNMACPTLRTTNDMPIVWPGSFKACGLVPFQINPHYFDESPDPTRMSETRDQRIMEFLVENDVAVVGLREGAWLRRSGPRLELGGVAGARIFRRNAAPLDLQPAADLAWLLHTPARFDLAAE